MQLFIGQNNCCFQEFIYYNLLFIIYQETIQLGGLHQQPLLLLQQLLKCSLLKIVLKLYFKLLGFPSEYNQMGNKQSASSSVYEQLLSKNYQFQDQSLQVIIGKKQQTLLHRSIGAVTWVSQQKTLVNGSGVLLSKNIVLTSAHNVYDRTYNRINNSLKFYLPNNGIAKHYYEVEAVDYLKQYAACQEQNKSIFHFALLKLSKQVQYNEFLQLALPCEICIMNSKQLPLEIYGYPSYPYQQNFSMLDANGEILKVEQYGTTINDKIVFVKPSEHSIAYEVNTPIGMRGSPVSIAGKIIAVHDQSQSQKRKLQIGRLISISLFDKLKEWCRKLNGHPFSLQNNNLCPHLKLIMKKYLDDCQMKRNMKKLILQKQSLKQINISKYSKLTYLSLSNNLLSEIDVSFNIHLQILFLSRNNLSTIDLTKNINLTHLYLQNNQISKIDLRNNINLTRLQLQQNQISQIDITKNTHLRQFYAYKNQLVQIDVTKNIYLTVLWLSFNKISAIDVTNNINLTTLYLYNNQIIQIDVTKNTRLIFLKVDQNQLFSIDITKNLQLRDLDLSENKLSAINVTKNLLLNSLILYNNQIYTIDVTKNTFLNHLSIGKNQISFVDVSKNSKLTLYNNLIYEINISKNTLLTHLQLQNNKLTAIDVTKNTLLTRLQLQNNQLTTIDVVQNTHLTWLNIANNQLTALDITKASQLTHLWVSENEICSIDVTKNTKLTWLSLQNNKLTKISLMFSNITMKPLFDIYSMNYNFYNQSSNVCEIQLQFNKADIVKCSQLKDKWVEKYQERWYSQSKCKYVFVLVQK